MTRGRNSPASCIDRGLLGQCLCSPRPCPMACESPWPALPFAHVARLLARRVDQQPQPSSRPSSPVMGLAETLPPPLAFRFEILSANHVPASRPPLGNGLAHGRWGASMASRLRRGRNGETGITGWDGMGWDGMGRWQVLEVGCWDIARRGRGSLRSLRPKPGNYGQRPHAGGDPGFAHASLTGADRRNHAAQLSPPQTA